MARMTHRGILGAAGLGGVSIGLATTAAALPASTSPEAELIALCDWIMTMRAETDALARATLSTLPHAEGIRFEDEQIVPLDEKRYDLVEEARAITAHTIEGHRARARMLVDGRWVGEHEDAGVWALVRDLIGGAA